MSTGITIHWGRERRPTQEEIGLLLADFFAGIAERVEPGGVGWNVFLPGLCSAALRRMPGIDDSYARRFDDARQPFRRCVEVWTDADGSTTEVMARFGDELTWALAKGVAATMAGWWDGKVEQ